LTEEALRRSARTLSTRSLLAATLMLALCGAFEPAWAADHAPNLRSYVGSRVTVRTNTDDAYARGLLSKLESFLAQADRRLSEIARDPTRPIHVTLLVFETQEEYQHYANGSAPGLVNNGGYYDGASRTVVTYRYNNSMQLYFHELVHALMGEIFQDHSFARYTRANWPVWFDEGMSEYLGSYRVIGDKIEAPARNKSKLAYLVNALDRKAFVPLPTLLRASAEWFSGGSMNIYYAESWGLVDFLLSSPPLADKTAAYFRRLRAHQDGHRAFVDVFGPDLDDLERRWREHIRSLARPTDGWIPLFNGQSIDDWTVHEGGAWSARDGEIVGAGARNYNYLIKSEVPMREFTLELEMMLVRGTAGLILGNNFHGEYPYYYLLDVARDAVMLRRSYTSTRIEPVKQAFAEIPLGSWVPIQMTVQGDQLRIRVRGRETLVTTGDRERYSLFGLYLYHAEAHFRNIRVKPEPPQVRPAGARTETHPASRPVAPSAP